MEYDVANDLFAEPASWDDVQRFLEQSRDEPKARLYRELSRIGDQLDRRDAVHTAVMDELARTRDRYRDRLQRLYRRGSGGQEKRRRVKARLAETERALQEERRQHWRDRQEVEEARREI